MIKAEKKRKHKYSHKNHDKIREKFKKYWEQKK